MEFNTRGKDGVCESHTDDILTIEGKLKPNRYSPQPKQRVWEVVCCGALID